MLLHFVCSDVSSLPLIYTRQMRQEYLKELYHFSLSAAAAKSTVRWCVSGPESTEVAQIVLRSR